MWLDLAIAMSCGGSLIACGWVMHALRGLSSQALVQKAAAQIASESRSRNPAQERVAEVANRIKAYAIDMAAGVDAHQNTIVRVNNTLSESGDKLARETVLTAANELIEANQAMQDQLREALAHIHEQTAQIESPEQRAQTDALTLLPNRIGFDQHLTARHALGPKAAGTLALLDIDYFTKCNDTHGNRAGDEALKVVASLLKVRLHRFGLVARYTGGKIAIVLDNCRLEEAAEQLEPVRIAIGEREIPFENKVLRVTASMGIAELMPGESTDQWLQRAEQGLRRSKESGRDCGHRMQGNEPLRIDLTELESGGEFAGGEIEIDAPSYLSDSSSPSIEIPDYQPVQLTKSGERPPDPGSFAYLPDRDVLREEYAEIRQRTGADVAVFVTAVRFASKPDDSLSRSILQIVRATMRSVDRLGYADDSTVLICMPGIDEETAVTRGQQICQSATAIMSQSKENSMHPIAAGVSKARSGEDFSQVVSRSIDLAIRCFDQGTDCLSDVATAAT